MSVLPNTKNLDVSNNEYQTKYSVQRIIDRLFENDQFLKQLYASVFGEIQIYEYDSTLTYDYGDIIWFLDSTKKLHILRCDVNQAAAGSLSKYSSSISFSSLGWKDLNPDIDILTSFGLEKKLNNYVNSIFKAHQKDSNYHEYGQISYGTITSYDIDRTLAKKDLTNLDSGRSSFFYPYQTINLQKTNSILDGYARRYDNGLLEYDIIFRLGYAGYKEIDSEYKISADVISSNIISLQDAHLDDQYFNSVGDMDIFASSQLSTFNSEIGSTFQCNRNDYVNSYAATIDFANSATPLHGNSSLYEFSSTDYMVFCSDVMSAKRSSSNTLNISPNSMAFCSKSTKSFVALLLEVPNVKDYSIPGQNAQNTGILANSFHCHIIGKGKKLS